MADRLISADMLGRCFQKYLLAPLKDDGSVPDPPEGYNNNFYSGVVWAYGKILECPTAYENDDES